jgi:hypothetical protein
MKAYLLMAAICLGRCSFALDALDLWSLQYAGSQNLSFVTYTGGLFLASGAGGRIVTSPDGVDWTEHYGAGVMLNGIASDGGTNFVAVGQKIAFPGPGVVRSADGKT